MQQKQSHSYVIWGEDLKELKTIKFWSKIRANILAMHFPVTLSLSLSLYNWNLHCSKHLKYKVFFHLKVICFKQILYQ